MTDSSPTTVLTGVIQHLATELSEARRQLVEIQEAYDNLNKRHGRALEDIQEYRDDYAFRAAEMSEKDTPLREFAVYDEEPPADVRVVLDLDDSGTHPYLVRNRGEWEWSETTGPAKNDINRGSWQEVASLAFDDTLREVR